jgi:hypothetical protein
MKPEFLEDPNFKCLGVKAVKLSTGEELFTEAWTFTGPKGEFCWQEQFYFLKWPLVIFQRQRENSEDIEKTMFPWTNFLANTLEDEFVAIGKQFVVAMDTGFPDAVAAWKNLSKKYVLATGKRLSEIREEGEKE